MEGRSLKSVKALHGEKFSQIELREKFFLQILQKKNEIANGIKQTTLCSCNLLVLSGVDALGLLACNIHTIESASESIEAWND